MKQFLNPLHLLLCLVIFLFPILLPAQSGFQKVVRYLGQEDYLLQAALVDTHGVVGLGYVTDSNNQDLLVHADPQGNVVWNRGMQNNPNTYFSMEDMCVEGYDIFASGESDGDTSVATLYKFELNGTLAWTRVLSYSPARVALTSLAGDQNGNVIFGGQEQDSIFSARGMVGKIRGSDGAPLWIRTFDDSLEFEVPVVASTPSGEVVAAGHASNWPFSTVSFPWVAKWDANGTLLWFKRLLLDGHIHALKADVNHIYVGGVDGPSNQLFVGKLSHSGTVMQWRTLDNPNHETFVQDMKLQGNHLRIVAYCDEGSIGETGLLMRLDSSLAPVWAWKDHYGMPLAVAGTDQYEMLHFVGSYVGDSLNDESILLGSIPDMAMSGAPCGMTAFVPIFDPTPPAIVSYAVTPATAVHNGYAFWSTYSLPLSPLTECQTLTGAEPSQVADPGDIEVWPNPFVSTCRVSLPDRECRVTCMDMTGKVVLRVVGRGNVELDLGHVAGGMYMIVVESGAERFTRRVVKN